MSRTKIYRVDMKVSITVDVMATSIPRAEEAAKKKVLKLIAEIPAIRARVMGAWSGTEIIENVSDDEVE